MKKKYKVKVIHSVEIVLDDDSELNKEEWIKSIASTIAYNKGGDYGKYISQEVEIEETY